MRIFNKYAYMGAIALVGAVGFTACSSEDDLTAQQNPTFDGESVKTQFAINIPYGGGNGTRLSEAVVQGQDQPVFRGMTNIRLVPFTSEIVDDPTATQTSIQPIALGAIGNGDLQTNGSYKVYNDVDIPVGVNHFLFYGEAAEAEGSTGSLINGALIPSYEVSGWPLGQGVDNITFSLKPILGTGSVESSQKTLAQMLTDIAGVSGTTGTKWSASTGELKTYYDNFITLKAGSANSIKAALQELYNSVMSRNVTDVDDLKAKIATAITTTYFDATEQADDTYTLNWKSTIGDEIKTFPNNLGLPDGSQQLKFESGEFSYAIPATTVQGGNILQQTAYGKYVYPASLFYTVNTDIKVADKTMTNAGVYQGTFSNWNDILGLDDFADGNVTNTTQSIALKNPIQYAVASLNLFVRFADTYIYDNGGNWPSGAPIGQIAVPIPNAGFPLTGVLVGGQKPVKWNFTTTTSTDDNDAWTIYDASMGTAVVKKASAYEKTPTAYTLALETKGVSEGAPQGETVRIALEMTNNSGSDFVGVDGIVPAGGKFYLVGELISSTTEGTDDDGNALKVFEQDHKTIAKVTINSLKSAYNCIPDLRAPRLELGLSVDLTWKQGLEYEITID